MADETVLWLNGPFGVGKTTVAKLMPHRRHVDPERIGWVMQRTFWRHGDFQRRRLWRRLAVRQVTRAARRGPIVVTMTIVDPEVRREVIDRIPDARVVALLAPRDVIEARAKGDINNVAGREWRLRNLDRCLAAFDDPAYGEHLDTTGKTPEEIVEEIG